MKRARHTFTLVEILTVTAMICLIMSALLVAYNGVYRSWATSNTIAAMKSAHLALDRYKAENNHYPQGTDTLGAIAKTADEEIEDISKDKSLVQNLWQTCSPFSYMNGDDLLIFDDFGDKPSKETPKPANLQEIYYHCSSQNNFRMMSKGKDGAWGGNDDIVYLPYGDGSRKAGFYRCSSNANGALNDEIEPLSD